MKFRRPHKSKAKEIQSTVDEKRQLSVTIGQRKSRSAIAIKVQISSNKCTYQNIIDVSSVFQILETPKANSMRNFLKEKTRTRSNSEIRKREVRKSAFLNRKTRNLRNEAFSVKQQSEIDKNRSFALNNRPIRPSSSKTLLAH